MRVRWLAGPSSGSAGVIRHTAATILLTARTETAILYRCTFCMSPPFLFCPPGNNRHPVLPFVCQLPIARTAETLPPPGLAQVEFTDIILFRVDIQKSIDFILAEFLWRQIGLKHVLAKNCTWLCVG